MLLRTARLPRFWSRDTQLELADGGIVITDVRTGKAESVPYGQLVDLVAKRSAFWTTIGIAYTSDGQPVQRAVGGLRVNPCDVTARVGSAIDELVGRHTDAFVDSLNRFLSYEPVRSLVESNEFIRRSQLDRLAFPTLDDLPLFQTEAFTKFASREVRKSVEAVRTAVAQARQSVESRNESFCQQELLTYAGLFDRLESYPLTDEQRRAIVHDEDANLVVAGAGSGKTSVVMGKVAYLLTKGLCAPEDILLLAYTAKAADEMRERIRSRSGFSVDVHTFHSLGLSILAEAEGSRPALSKMAEDQGALETFVTDAVRSLLGDSSFAPKLVGFFSYHLQPTRSEFDFDREGLHIDYLVEQGVATLRDLSQGVGPGGGYRTIKRDNVRSVQECRIANFLFVNKVAYEYERLYPHGVPWAGGGKYRPDFYLPEYDLYIEHFGVDRDGNTAPYVDRQEYACQMQDKRRLHRDRDTKLVETYSYEHSEETWESDIEAKLKEHGVRFQPMTPAEFGRVLTDTKLTNRLTSLTCTFLNLFKSARLDMDEVRRRAGKLKDQRRAAAYLDIFERIYGKYRDQLADRGEIDFSDMINLACEHIESGRVRRRYRYVIVDEYQDISYARYRLVKALLQQSEGSRLFCVGDDWQSIYRFTGSDISLMASFGQFFGHHKRL